MPFQAVVVRRRSAGGPAPTVLLPHGGPHSAYVASYTNAIAYLAALGYTVVAVRPPTDLRMQVRIMKANIHVLHPALRLRGFHVNRVAYLPALGYTVVAVAHFF